MRRLKGLIVKALVLLINKKSLSHKESGVFLLPKLFVFITSGIASAANGAKKLLKPLVLMNFFIVRHFDYHNPKTYS